MRQSILAIWYKIDGKKYYLPDTEKALKFGFFKLPNGNVYKITGYKENNQPIVLKFEPFHLSSSFHLSPPSMVEVGSESDKVF